MLNLSIYQDAPPCCHYLLDLIATDDFLDELEKSKNFTIELLGKIPAEKENFPINQTNGVQSR